MKNVPTIGKFLAIMAAFGVFALAVAAYSGLQMWNIDKGYSALNDQEMMPSIMVTRGDGALETARSAIADLMISTTDAGNRAALDTLAAATKEFQSTMDSAIAAAPKDADTLRALKSRGLDALGQECANAVKQGLASHTASENAASQQVYLNECAPKFPALSADMRRQVDVMTTTASKGNDALTGTTKGTIGTTFALILGGLAVVMTGGFFAVRALVSDPLKALAERMRRLAGGDLDVQVEGQDRHDEVGAMAKAVQVFKDNGLKARAMEAEAVQLRSTAETERERTEAERRRVEAEQAMVVKTLAASLGRLAQGDLSSQIEAEFNGQYLQIKTDFNAAVQSLAEAMGAISNATGAIRGGSDEIAQASDDLSRRTEQQAASLEETAAALDQITATVKRSAEGAKRASGAASTAKGEAQQSGAVMRDAVTAMGEIEESSGKITQIIGVIDEIAFQTNLLALNAGVEAARAGDAGKGFAVVASEVRALAQRSADAAKEIKTLIASSSSQVERGVKLVGDTGQALTSIVAKVTEIDTLISEIALSSQEQATGLAQVNTAVNQMDQVTQQNAAMVEQATAAASNLRGEAGELAKLVSRFRVAGEPARGRPEVAQPGRHQPAQNPVARAQARIASSSLARKPAPQSAPAQDGWEEF